MKLGPVVIQRHERGQEQPVTRDMADILAQYEVEFLSEDNSFMVVSPKATKLAHLDSSLTQETGAQGSQTRRYIGGEEYNQKLAGTAGLYIYDEMRRNDAAVRQSLRIAKTPVLAGRWFIQSYEPGEKKYDEQAKFIENALFKWQTSSWFNFMTESLLMLDFGYYMFEKVFEIREVPVGETVKPMAVWRKFASRHPFDVEEWDYDAHGGPNGVWMYPFEDAQPVWLDISRLLVMTFDKEAGNMEGISLLRSAYKHHYYKDNLYKIDAIQKERHGIGIPVIKLPVGFSPQDKILANELGRNLRTNERAHVVLPPLWELEFAEVRGSVVDIEASIAHHDNQIVRNVLANFVGTETSAAAVVQVELFLKATRFIADIIADVVNQFAIPELIGYNWGEQEGYPQLGVRRIGETADWRTLSFAIRNLIGANVIKPDDPLEDWIRKEMDVPTRDPDTAREPVTPQGGGGNAGLPRQGKPSARPGQGTGNDKSGGK